MHIRTLSEQKRLEWLRLARSENIGPRTFIDLIDHFPDPADALDALPQIARRARSRRKLDICSVKRAERELTDVENRGGRSIALCEPDYPVRLRHIPDPPPLIHVAGDITLAGRIPLAIVGARNASAGGRRLARQIAADVGQAGVSVISGLARGIDTAAHEASLDTGTIAVIATGLDHIYPPENEALFHGIRENGLLATEMPPGTRPLAKHFPRRNRIVSGLSAAILVVEAALRSGSLITARLAAEQGRDVFAVPGSPLDDRSAGSNRLIRDGAELVTGADDILQSMGATFARPEALPLETIRTALVETDESGAGRPDVDIGDSDRAHLLSLLGTTSTHVDTLIQESGLSPSVVQMFLLELDIAGQLTREGHGSVAMNTASAMAGAH